MIWRKVFPVAKIKNAVAVIDDYLITNKLIIKNESQTNTIEEEILLRNEGVLLSGYKPVTHHHDFL